MFLKKFNGHNRKITNDQINETIEFLRQNQPGFIKLSLEAQFRLGMQHYQCERGRMQRGKLWIDMISHIVPWIAIIFALKK